jgi:tRNA modification GTPase
MLKDTIAALSTPHGMSAIAVLRVSGPAVLDICKTILPDFKMKPRLAALTNAKNENGEIIDKLLAIYFPAPNSYTGEDTLELFPHGNPFIIRKLIEAICKLEHVRLANKGEFTERAFLNGKIDLTQAEAIGDILSANNSKSLANAHKLLSGEISSEIKELAESIKEFSALLELEVDFEEEWRIENGELRIGNLEEILNNLRNLKKRFKVSQNEMPRVVLFGAPNAGKSSLINALVKENRLLVNEVPGTTRDFVEVPLKLPSGDILLIDTAGLACKAQSEIDTQAMQKTEEILKKANLKILVADISIPLPKKFAEWEKIADLTVETHIEQHWCQPSIDAIIEKLEATFFPKTEESQAAWISSERQISCIKKAEECALKTLKFLKTNPPQVELAAFEMREARNALCSIIGEISDESILNAIFSSYCIGK